MLSAAVRRLSPLQWAGVGLGGCAVLLALLGLLAPASAFFFPLLSLWASVGLFVLALCVLRVAGVELDFFHKAVVFGIWAVAVVYFYWTLSSRSFVYVWDYANYLLKQYDAEAAFAQSAGAGLAYIFGSMAGDYTNFITLFTEFPFCLTDHTGDAYAFSQVFCILPTLLVLLAGLVVKVGQILNVKNRIYYFLFGMTLTAAYPFLRMSAVLAQPDWFGLIFAFAILLLTLDLRFDKLEPVRFGLIFLATAAIILARRWFLYFVVGYYFAYALLLIAGCVRLAKGGEKNAALVRVKNLVLFGLASVVAMVILLWPMVSHILAYNYAGRYSYYNGGGLALEAFYHIGRMGLFNILLMVLGLAFAAKHRAPSLPCLAGCELVVSILLFTRVQNTGSHQFLLFLPGYFILFLLGAAALAEGITRHRNLKLGCWAFVLVLSMSVRCSPLTTLAMPGFVTEHFPIQIPATQYFIQRGEVVLRDGVFQHAGVHGGGDQLGAFGRQHHGGEHIVGDAVGHFGDHVGRGGGHQDHVGLFGQRDVGDLELEVAVKGVHHALVTGQGLKGDGSDELGGVFGHDDLHIGPQLAQCAGHIGHLIGGNAAADAQKDAFAL